MFNGAAKYGPKEFDRVLEARGGHSNAYTSNDVTAYYEDFAAEALETVLDLESDRMRSLRLTDESLEQEREVVKEERRLRTDNSIFGLMEEQLEALVFLAHPYRWPVIGWMDDIERITRGRLRVLLPHLLRAQQRGHLLRGRRGRRRDARAARARLRRHSRAARLRRRCRRASRRSAASGAPGSATPPRRPRSWSAGGGRPRGARTRPSSTCCRSAWGWASPRGCASGWCSRRSLRSPSRSPGAGAVDPGVFFVFAELAPGVSVERAEAALWDEVARMADRGVSEREVVRARALLRSSVLHELGTHHGIAHALGQAEALLGDWREADRALEHYARVTPAEVRRVATEFLSPAQRCVVELVPEGQQPARAPRRGARR